MNYTLLLDTSSLMYRAFFALPDNMVGENGHPINAVHGYLDMTARLLKEYQPDELIHVFDADWRPAGRVTLYPPYKADRPEDPEALPPQFELLRRVLAACGQTMADAPDWEADDGIGTLCSQGTPGDRFDVVTGDRDMLQLVRDDGDDGDGKRGVTVRVLYTVRGVSELAVFDEAAVVEKYGVPPQRYVDFAILRGDPSDGLPGVKGIGEKTATKLVQAYPSLDALLDDANSQTPRLAQNLLEARDYIATMFGVVPIRRDVALTIARPALDEAAVAELAKAYRLGGPIGRMNSANSRPCPFCSPQIYSNPHGDVLLENEHCLYISGPQPILQGSGMIIPRAHRETLFDLTPEEWTATYALLHEVKALLDSSLAPDGYNIGWNCGRVGGQTVFHAHLHIIPRFADEPLAGRGIRWWLKQAGNRRGG